MLKNRMEAARKVAVDLRSFEEAIDTALTEGNMLAVSLILGRKKAKLSPVVGHDAIAKVTQVLWVLTAARHNLVEAHGVLADVRERMGLRVLGTGDLGKLGEPPLTGANEAVVIAGTDRVAA